MIHFTYRLFPLKPQVGYHWESTSSQINESDGLISIAPRDTASTSCNHKARTADSSNVPSLYMPQIIDSELKVNACCIWLQLEGSVSHLTGKPPSTTISTGMRKAVSLHYRQCPPKEVSSFGAHSNTFIDTGTHLRKHDLFYIQCLAANATHNFYYLDQLSFVD